MKRKETLFYIEKKLTKENIHDSIKELYKNDLTVKSILGVDIVGYSKYPPEIQYLIPMLFQEIVEITFNEIKISEDIFFDNNEEIIK